MSEGIKVTDKRMFTPDGELREEFRDLESGEAEEKEKEEGTEEERGAGEEEPAARSAGETGEPTRVATPGETTGAPTGAAVGASPGGESVQMPEEGEAVGFLDLVAVIAEPIALYLGDAQLPDGRSMENLDMARLHIDLLDVLKEKTEGNLTSEERSVLEDVLYRLRMRYVQKRG